jgi:hypothetical protein
MSPLKTKSPLCPQTSISFLSLLGDWSHNTLQKPLALTCLSSHTGLLSALLAYQSYFCLQAAEFAFLSSWNTLPQASTGHVLCSHVTFGVQPAPICILCSLAPHPAPALDWSRYSYLFIPYVPLLCTVSSVWQQGLCVIHIHLQYLE